MHKPALGEASDVFQFITRLCKDRCAVEGGGLCHSNVTPNVTLWCAHTLLYSEYDIALNLTSLTFLVA